MKDILCDLSSGIESLEKSIDKSKLVPVQVQVSRKGKSFTKTVWKKASEVEESGKQLKIPEEPAKDKPSRPEKLTFDNAFDGLPGKLKGAELAEEVTDRLRNSIGDRLTKTELAKTLEKLGVDTASAVDIIHAFGTGNFEGFGKDKEKEEPEAGDKGSPEDRLKSLQKQLDDVEKQYADKDMDDYYLDTTSRINKEIKKIEREIGVSKETLAKTKAKTEKSEEKAPAPSKESSKDSGTPKTTNNSVESGSKPENLSAEFDKLKKTDKQGALKFLKDNGVTWQEHSHPAINLMRATMAVNGTKPVAPNKGKGVEKPAKVSNSEAVEAIKAKGVKWEEHSHPAINLMRAKMAEKKFNENPKKDEKSEDSKEDKGTILSKSEFRTLLGERMTIHNASTRNPRKIMVKVRGRLYNVDVLKIAEKPGFGVTFKSAEDKEIPDLKGMEVPYKSHSDYEKALSAGDYLSNEGVIPKNPEYKVRVDSELDYNAKGNIVLSETITLWFDKDMTAETARDVSKLIVEASEFLKDDNNNSK